MTHTFEISFVVDTTDPTIPLNFEAWINDQKIVEINHVKGAQHVSTKISDTDSDHELRLVLKNKSSQHTKVNEFGQIVADARLLITNLLFDEIPLGYVFTKQADYIHDFNGTQMLVKEKFYGEMGCNGTVNLKFSSPVYLWLLENM